MRPFCWQWYEKAYLLLGTTTSYFSSLISSSLSLSISDLPLTFTFHLWSHPHYYFPSLFSSSFSLSISILLLIFTFHLWSHHHFHFPSLISSTLSLSISGLIFMSRCSFANLPLHHLVVPLMAKLLLVEYDFLARLIYPQGSFFNPFYSEHNLTDLIKKI